MKRYVVGFLFDGDFVALIKKARPAWQAGRLNGIGGHIEADESPDQAMSREFREEAGVDIDAEKWRLFAMLKGEVPCSNCAGAGIDHGMHSKEYMEQYTKDHGGRNPHAPLVICERCGGLGVESVEVFCFTCRRPANLKSVTDEAVAWYNIAVINDGTTIPNLAWLVPMALDPNNPTLMAVVENVAR